MRQHPQTIPAVAIALERDAGLYSDKALVERALAVVECLAGRGFEIVPKAGEGWANRFDEARRTGDWRGVSDADWKAWVDVMRTDLTRGIEAPPAREAVFNVRVGWPDFIPKAVRGYEGDDVASVTRAAKLLPFGGNGADISRWMAFSYVERRFLAPDEPAPAHFVVGPYDALVRDCRPTEISKGEAEADAVRYEERWEDGFRNIVTILHGPGRTFEIGRIVEEVRTLSDIVAPLTIEKRRLTKHHSFVDGGQRTTISGDTQDVERILDLIGKGQAAEAGEIPRGTVIEWNQAPREVVDLKPGGLVDLPLGKLAAASAGMFDRDVPPLGIFWSDGLISFVGDAAEMTAFRDMAARVVGVPGSRDAA